MSRFSSWIGIGLLVALVGCATSVAYYEQAIGEIVISPDDYRVNADNCPKYRIRYGRLMPISGSRV
jgi:hypothetical protein